MATDTSLRAPHESVRGALLSLSARLEDLWREAWETAQDNASRTDVRASWAVATQRLEQAIAELERYAGTVDPTLGRRDWSSRRPQVAAVPAVRAQVP